MGLCAIQSRGGLRMKSAQGKLEIRPQKNYKFGPNFKHHVVQK